MNRKYGNQTYISVRKLAEASGVSPHTILACIRALEPVMEDEDDRK